jgi:hypothetical protein
MSLTDNPYESVDWTQLAQCEDELRTVVNNVTKL